jgi:uncharacterized protein involved in exopolysaccharide biosynthesis
MREARGQETPAAGPGERVLDLAEVLRFFRRHGLLVFGVAAAAAAITIVAVLWVLPPTYEASATLLVVPPTFASQLKPPALSVQGYQRLLESDVVIAETNRRLIQQGVLEEDQALAIGEQLQTRIFVSRRAEETSLAPVIEATAFASKPEEAAAVANAWVEAFLAHSRQLVAGSTLPTIEFIEDQYHTHDERLKKLGEDRAAQANDYQERLDRVQGEWERRLDEASRDWNQQLVDLKKGTEDGIAGYQTETRQVIDSFAAARGVPAGQAADPAAAPAAPGDAPLVVSDDLAAKLRQLVTLRVQLAQTPQFLLVEKAVSDDALWQAMALSQSALFDLQQVVGRSLLSQEVNPVHNDLALRLADLELQIESGVVVGGASVGVLVAGLEKLQRERSAGLAKLLADRGIDLDARQREKVLDLDQLRRQQDQATSVLQRERDLVLDRLDREITHERVIFDELAKNYNQATLARAEQDLGDVRLGSPAEPALQPTSRQLGLKAGLAALLGAVAGAFIAMGRDVEGR